MAGKPTPEHLRVIKGTARADRMNPNPPTVSSGLVSAPEWLNERANEIFGQVSGILDTMGLQSPVDAMALSLLASRLEEVEALSKYLDDCGRTYATEGPSGQMFRPRPEVTMRADAMRQAQSLLGDFGLNPAARSKVSITTPPKENPFAALDRIK